VVLHAWKAPIVSGLWQAVADDAAAGAARLWHPDAGASRLSLSSQPIHYFELTFTAEAGRAYRLWLRGKAENNSRLNDSVFVQFSNSVNVNGSAIYRIGSTSAAVVTLENCDGCGLSEWGWQDTGAGATLGPLIYFATTGTHRIRVQTREDGFSIDQVVLSAATYLNAAPGAAKDDTVVLPES